MKRFTQYSFVLFVAAGCILCAESKSDKKVSAQLTSQSAAINIVHTEVLDSKSRVVKLTQAKVVSDALRAKEAASINTIVDESEKLSTEAVDLGRENHRLIVLVTQRSIINADRITTGYFMMTRLLVVLTSCIILQFALLTLLLTTRKK